MERTLQILNSFNNLTKLEHHRCFLEFCKTVNVIPTGLRLKKTPSLLGKPSDDFEETWKNILATAQDQLLTLLIIQYRDQLQGALNKAYENLRKVRQELTREELDHIREQVKTSKETLHRKRVKKALKLCADSGKDISTERLQDLQAADHHHDEIFDSSDLRPAEPRQEDPTTIQTTSREERDEEVQVTADGRLKGRFVSGSVVNLSRRELSEEDVSLLSKGLKFSPTPTDIDRAKLKEDLEAYKRRMRLRWHFRNNEDNFTSDDQDKFRARSTWQPPKDDPVLENYLSLLEKEVMSVSPEGKNFSNLSSSEQLSLKKLKSDRNIVIKEADKGSAVVVWDREDYISEANRQVDDRQVYEEVEVDPSVDLGKTINSRLNELREEDPGLEEVTDYLKVKDSKLGRFYLLPKIHKGLSSVKCNIDPQGSICIKIEICTQKKHMLVNVSAKAFISITFPNKMEHTYRL